jgi:hypothetical protein
LRQQLVDKLVKDGRRRGEAREGIWRMKQNRFKRELFFYSYVVFVFVLGMLIGIWIGKTYS